MCICGRTLWPAIAAEGYSHTVCAKCVATAAVCQRKFSPDFAVWNASAEAASRRGGPRALGRTHFWTRIIALHSQQCCLRPPWWRRWACTAFLTEGCAGTTICSNTGMVLSAARALWCQLAAALRTGQRSRRGGAAAIMYLLAPGRQHLQQGGRRWAAISGRCSCVQRRRSRPRCISVVRHQNVRGAEAGAERQRTRATLASSLAHTASNSRRALRDRMAKGVPVETANAGVQTNEQVMQERRWGFRYERCV